jgi:hypothetical protein
MRNVFVWALFVYLSSCFYYEDVPRTADPAACLESNLLVTATAQNSSGCGQADGSITASASGGSGSYTFSIDGGETKQASSIFNNLTGGQYDIILFDGQGCSATTTVIVNITGSNLAGEAANISPDTECLSNNGAITLSASGGTQPYTFSIGSTTNSTGTFTSLAAGTYNATITDASSCAINFSVSVPDQSSVSYANDIAPLLTVKCNTSTCHGGTKTGAKNLTTYESVKLYAAEIKQRTASGNMPKAPKPGGSLTAEEIKIIACWVDAGAQSN